MDGRIWSDPQHDILKFVNASLANFEFLGFSRESCQPDVFPFILVVMIFVLILADNVL
jgi:hypothetical protein